MQSKPAAVVTTFIRGALGFGEPRRDVASSFLFIASFIFYLYTTSFLIKLNVYPFYYRNTYYTIFDVHIISRSVDYIILFSLTAAWFFVSLKDVRARIVAVGILGSAIAFQAAGVVSWSLDLVALLSTPLMIALLIANRLSQKKILSVRLRVLRNHLGVTSLILAISGLVIASTFVAGLYEQQAIRNYSYELLLIFNNLSPILILVLAASLPVKILIGSVIGRRLKEKQAQESAKESRGGISRKKRFYYLLFFVILSILMGLIPHLQTINKDGQKVGVDTPFYINWISVLDNSQTPQQFITNAFVTQAHGDRPLTLIFIYSISRVVGPTDLQTVVEALPIILGPGLVLTVYWLTREITKDERTSLVASFITAVSFHTLIGIYAGFYANWFSLIAAYLAIIFLFRYLQEQRARDLTAFSGLLFFTLLSHVYTWSVIAIVMGVFLAVTLLRNRDKRRASIVLLMILTSSVAFDIARASFTDLAGGIERDIKLANNLTGPDQFDQRWNNLRYTSTTFVGGIFGNVVILALGLYWMYRSKTQDSTTILLLAFFSVGMIPIIIGDWVVQTRILYNIPFQIPAAIAISQLRDKPGGNILFAGVCIWLVFLAVRTASNFYFIAPN